MKTPQEWGYDWERAVAKRIGGEPVPQSGAGVRKLDVGRHTLVVSAKDTGDKSIRITDEMLDELARATTSAGGIGATTTGVLFVRIRGIDRQVAILDLEHYLGQLEEEVEIIPPTKDTARRRRAGEPTIMRK